MDDLEHFMRQFMRGEREPEDLHPELEAAKVPNQKGGIGIAHCFITVNNYSPEDNGWYNQELEVCSARADQAKQDERWSDFITCHQVDFYPHALEVLWEVAPPEEWARVFRDAWYGSKSIMNNEAKWRALLGKIGGGLMTNEERVCLEKFPDVFPIYRGCKVATHVGLSWSKKYEWAKWFARDCSGVMLEGQVKRQNAIAYLRVNQEEHKIVVLPENVSDIAVVGRWFEL